MRTTAIRERLSAGSIAGSFPLFRTFLIWLHDRGATQLKAVTNEDFRAYATLDAARNVEREFKSHLLFAVTRIWLIAPYLPEADQLARPTWEDTSNEEDRLEVVIGPANRSGENRTAPVHPQSMSALLLSALRFVDVYGPDILRALADQATMRASIPVNSQPGQQETVAAYLRDLEASGRALPGTRGRRSKAPDGSNLAVEYLAATLGVSPHILRSLRSRPLSRGAPMQTVITGHVDGEPWCEAIDYNDVGLLRHLLMTACFIVTAYLSGMRVEEKRAELRLMQYSAAAPTG